MAVQTFPNEYGYTLLRRVEDGPVEVWRESDWTHVHTATEFLYAFQWAYAHPAPLAKFYPHPTLHPDRPSTH